MHERIQVTINSPIIQGMAIVNIKDKFDCSYTVLSPSVEFFSPATLHFNISPFSDVSFVDVSHPG